MDKKLIITNLLSVTIAVTGTLFAIGCADNSDELKPVTSLDSSTWLEKTQTLAASLLEGGMLVSVEGDDDAVELQLSANIDNVGDGTFFVDVNGQGVHSYQFNGSLHTLSTYDKENDIQDLSSDEFKHQILWINEVVDGFEGQVRLVKPGTVQHIKNEGAGNEFEYDYKVKGFFKHISLKNTPYTLDEQSGQSNISVLALYYNTASDQINLEGKFDGDAQLTHGDKTASIQLNDTSSSNELRELIISHQTGAESAPIANPTSSFVTDTQSIDPLLLAFDISYMVDDATEAVKRVEIRHAAIQGNDNVTQAINWSDNPVTIPPADADADADDANQ